MMLSRCLPMSAVASLFAVALSAQGPPRLLGWNDLGMHCLDGDTSVFSILPPFNTVHAQLVVGGRVVTTGFTVTYEAIADPSGSINRTSIGKTDFWQHAQALFGVTLPLDEGLRGFRMPGTANVPQAMHVQTAMSDFLAEGVPITPYDDNGRMNPYPLMRLVARNGTGQQIAATDVVLPVSAEMACVDCHGSGGNPAARPAAGWQHGPAAIDDRLNILALHDERHLADPAYTAALQALGYSSSGLLATAVQQNHPVLCANCHGSNALGTTGQPGATSLTSAMHRLHANARLPDGRVLDAVTDRTSCYTCHPGAATQCLRGAMGKAIGADGQPMMACQDCHGSMSEVGARTRNGWLEEPNCQNCHTGDAVTNAGAIRFDDAFDAPGHLRTTTNARFATTANAPSAPYSLYRFSTGHGGLQCSACHGSPHAIWPSAEANDNLQSQAAQGHLGTIVECTACHQGLGEAPVGGPHGMHGTGSSWAEHHGDVAERQGVASCRPCHGTDYRGTVLSRSQSTRTYSTRYGTRQFWRGYEVGCYDCHNGPNSETTSPNTPPLVQDRSESTPTDQPLQLTLAATDPNPDVLTLRLVEQPRHGAVAFSGSTAVYRARRGYVGTDSFTYAAADGKSNSNLGTVTIAVQPPSCAGAVTTYGFGCALPDGSVPSLRVDGCPTGDRRLTFAIENGPASGFASLAFGASRGIAEITPDGCTLRIGGFLGLSPLLGLVGGTATFPLTVPSALVPLDLTVQGFCLSAATPRGFVATPGVELAVR